MRNRGADSASRPRRAGTPLRAKDGAAALTSAVSSLLPSASLLPLALWVLGWWPASLGAQVRPDTLPPPDTLQVDTIPPGDSVRADTIPIGDTVPVDTIPPGDTLRVDTIPLGDTVPVDTIPPRDTLRADSLARADTVPPDSAQAVSEIDTVPPPVLPELPRPLPAGWNTAVWEWGFEDLVGERALNLAELLTEIPTDVPLRGGDYGQPMMISSMAGGGGRVRVFLDGFELAPLEGGVVDLGRISLSGVGRVRVERDASGLTVDLTTQEIEDPRPYTFLEVGTGDLQTNILRGVFSHPNVLKGALSVGLDRVITEGPKRAEAGSNSGAWLRYALLKRDRGGLVLEYRAGAADRGGIYEPSHARRSDMHGRLRWKLADGLVADAFVGRSSLSPVGDENEAPVPTLPRSQAGLQLAYRSSHFWAHGVGRKQWGDAWPSWTVGLRAGLGHGAVGHAEAAWDRESWEDDQGSTLRVRAWTRSLFGFSVFGEWENSTRGVPAPVFEPEKPEEPPDSLEDPPEEPEPEEPLEPVVRFTEREATRLGAQFAWRGFHLGGAWLRLEADSLVPFGLPPDADGLVLPGGTAEGLEVTARLPLYPRGLALEGSYVRWETDSPWRYLPEEQWDGRLSFHRAFLQTGNLEVWSDVGVKGREVMAMPFADPDWVPEDPENPGVPDLQFAPWYQSWYFRLQIRVVTVRLFIVWDNIVLKDDNQDFPGRVLPSTRTLYGVRWTLWN